ncbi:extracellular solute-binding protein [Paenibacillus flagellatus]|uniref:GntR family transcriptional regulator n=1 Tax=Paenibacillus flagellatus TaxID=2211139 RepID=A0A2V5KD56_9BACL|nr:extracellular solute-binding protein [Paenibacillus flagellatus]PYI57591.1 GntR family transcriptional regulator [Paenibacillus flagellatus]
MANRPSRASLSKRMDEMIRSIRDEVISGKRKVGDFLPSERELGKLFSISNKSVRQCLDVLVSEGLIEKIPKVGNRIAGVSDDNSITIRFGCYRTTIEEADLGTLVSMFHKQYPRIRVETIIFDHFVSMRQALEAGIMDVVTVNVANYRQMIEAGCLHLLEERQPNGDTYPFLNKAFTFEGRLYVQPFIFSPVVLCYNRDHFRQKGLLEPDSGWTWDELRQASERLAVPNERYGFYFFPLSLNRWPVFLLQSGMKLPPEEEPVRIAGTPWMDAFRLCRDVVLGQSGTPLFYEEADAEKLFVQEKVSMILTTYFGLNALKKAEFDYDIAPLPSNDSPKTLLLAIGLGINAKSEQKEAAQTFVDFIASYRSQLDIRQRTLSIPASKPAAEWIGEEAMFRPLRYPMHRDIVPTYRLHTDLNVTMDMLPAIMNELKLFWAGLESERTVCSNIENVLNEIRQRRRDAASDA